MNLRIILCLFLIFLINLATRAKADTLDKQSVGLRYDDNVYLSPQDKTGDYYLLLNSRFQFPIYDRALRMRLDFTDYTKENSNDYVGLNLSTKLASFNSGLLKSTDLSMRLFHKNYFNENAATTDNGFTHTGAGLDLDREWMINSGLTIAGQLAYENRFFHNFDGRNDHQFMTTGSMDFYPSPLVTPYTFADAGVVVSSLGYYSNVFFDIGGGAKGPLSKSLSWLADLNFRSTTYMSRSIDQAIEVKRRGTLQTVTSTEKERTRATSIGAGLRWHAEKNLDIDGRLNFTNQSSNNPNFAYQDNTIMFSLNYTP